jgi:predicted methyltransferase
VTEGESPRTSRRSAPGTRYRVPGCAPSRGSLATVLIALALTSTAGCKQAPARPAESGQSTGLPADSFPAPSRPIASIVSPRWSNEDARDRAREADTVMALLGVGPGMRVADVGAGSGYYTVRLSPRVGPHGRVYAQDITPRYLRDLRRRVEKAKLDNVTPVLGASHDPRLPRQSVDLALLVHMYHEVEQPYGLLHNLYPALRPGARVAVVDLDRATSSHGTPPAQLRCELRAVGYEETAAHSLGAGGYLVVFVPARRPTPAEVRANAADPAFCAAAAPAGAPAIR